MGFADTVTKAYMNENSVFADAFNYFIYGGRKIINAAELHELDPTEIAIPSGIGEKDRKDAVQKYQDLLKGAVVKQDGKLAYVLLGIENQTDISD